MNDSVTVGDAFIFANHNPAIIAVHVHGRVRDTITIEPPQDRAWPDYVEHVARPALIAAGWQNNAWHRPRNNPDVLATSVVWRS